MSISKCPSLTKTVPEAPDLKDAQYSLKEDTFHGSCLFPVAIYEDDLTREAVSWHWHEELEAGYIVEGACLLECGKNRVTLREGDVFFVNTNVLHAVRNAVSGKCARLKSLVFHASIVGGSMQSVFHQKYVLPILEASAFRDAHFHGEEATDLRNLLMSAWNACRDETDAYELTVRNELSLFLKALTQVLKESQGQQTDFDHRQESRAQVMLNFIHSHYADEISLPEIAAEAAVSTSEALRSFRAVIGTSPIRYLKEYRLKQAASLIRSTDYSMSDICALCGFADPSYFTKAFRETYHCTPKAYRT